MQGKDSPVLWEEVLEPGATWSHVLKRGTTLRLTDLEGGDVRIANLPQRIKEVFDLTGFTSLFEIYDSTLAAVGSF